MVLFATDWKLAKPRVARGPKLDVVPNGTAPPPPTAVRASQTLRSPPSAVRGRAAETARERRWC